VLPFDQKGASARGGDASTAAADHDPPDLGCLDHAFFAAEIIRLLRRAQTVQARLACSRHRRDHNDASQLMLEETIDALVAKKGDMDYEVPFVPEEVLQELYSLDEIVCSISSGGLLPWTGFQPCGPTTATTTTTNEVIRGDGGNEDGEEEHADDGGYSGLERRAEERGAVMGRNGNTWVRPHCEDDVDDGDDDDGLDEYGAASQYEERFERMALSLTPGRKPTRRRNNAGGSKGNLVLAAAASSGNLSGRRWAGGPS
jgi:hypothetical protein